VACDKPFSDVAKPEFRRLLQYTHGSRLLNIPMPSTVRNRVKDLGDSTFDKVKSMISVRY
jgi:hypothetical protein